MNKLSLFAALAAFAALATPAAALGLAPSAVIWYHYCCNQNPLFVQSEQVLQPIAPLPAPGQVREPILQPIMPLPAPQASGPHTNVQAPWLVANPRDCWTGYFVIMTAKEGVFECVRNRTGETLGANNPAPVAPTMRPCPQDFTLMRQNGMIVCFRIERE
jgi:hypothetical protein